MQTKAKWIELGTILICLNGIGPAYADISSVNPAEGTIGTEFSVMGSGFGEKRGKVQLGQERCKILSWGDAQITCQVVIPQLAGDYVVSVSPQESKKDSEPMTFSSFAMRAPQIDEAEPMRLVTPLEVVTITGNFFGDKRDQVGMRDTTGLTLEARVFDWSMNSITFEIPAGLTGTAHLGVKNDVGLGIQPYWCTFTPLPPNLPKATRTYFIKETHENAVGIFFNNQFWYFMTEKDLATDTSNDIWAGWFDYKTGTFDGSAPDPGGTSDAQVAPIVIDHELWLFHTGESGQLFYKKYTSVGTDPETQKPIYGWEDTWQRIGGTGTEANKELAPVWNPIKNRLEVFYWNSSSIYRTYTDDKGATWHTTAKVEGLGTVLSAPSAIFWQQTATNGVTLLAFSGQGNPDLSNTTEYSKVYAVQDGVVQGTRPLWWSLYQTGQPFIAHLGEDYVGLVFENGPLDQIDVAKMNKRTSFWNYNPLVPYLNQDVKRSPSIAVNMQEVEDDAAPLGVRYDVVAYLFWGADRGWVGTAANMSSVETLGWWQEDDITDFDTAAANTRADTFGLWQVVGVVDAPPFVLNGAPYAEECDLWTCNSLTFANEQGTSTTFGWDMSLGAYFETGDKSPVKVELTATMSAKFEETKNKTVEVATTLFRSKEGIVSVWYLAPNIRTHHVQWYDMTGNPTGNYIQQMELLSVQLLSQEFDPREFPWPDLHAMPLHYFADDFPIHASDPHDFLNDPSEADWRRLATYGREQTNTAWFSNPIYWNRSSEKHLKWVDSGETNKEIGFEVKYKIGTQVGEYFGIGVEGSFGIKTTSKVTVENHSELSLVPGLSEGEPFESFRIDAYWLEPNPDGYWVPMNRRGTGDAPWFITYRVSDITPTP